MPTIKCPRLVRPQHHAQSQGHRCDCSFIVHVFEVDLSTTEDKREEEDTGLHLGPRTESCIGEAQREQLHRTHRVDPWQDETGWSRVDGEKPQDAKCHLQGATDPQWPQPMMLVPAVSCA